MDLDVLTALLLDPFLTADEAAHEAAAHRRLREPAGTRTNPQPPCPADPARPGTPRPAAREPR